MENHGKMEVYPLQKDDDFGGRFILVLPTVKEPSVTMRHVMFPWEKKTGNNAGHGPNMA